MASAIIMRSGKLLSLVTTLFAATTLGCCADGPRIIIVDGWWARDFAVQACAQTLAWQSEHGSDIEALGCDGVEACPHLMPVLLACTIDSARTMARIFERQLVRALASEPACAGLIVARHGGPGEPDVVVSELMRRPHWMLAVDYLPGLASHGWTLLSAPYLSAKGPRVAAEGEGTVRQIAADICTAVKRTVARR
jgi:hypothetical protein